MVGSDMHPEVASVLFADTDPKTEAVLINLLRQATPARKLAMVGELNATVRTLAQAGLRQRFPSASNAELQRRLADLLLGADLASQVYGPIALESADDHWGLPSAHTLAQPLEPC